MHRFAYLCFASAVALSVLAAPAQATSYVELNFSFCGPTQAAHIWRDTTVYEGNVYTGVYNLNLNTTDGTYSGAAAVSLINDAGPDHIIPSFCIDIRQNAPTGPYVRYDIYALEDAPVGSPMLAVKADDLRRLFAGHFQETLTNNQAAAFQAAVWEIINETSGTYNVYNGAFHIAESWGSGWGGLANTYLGDLASYAPDSRVSALVNASAQDYALTISSPNPQPPHVPEPMTIAGVLMGLGGLVGYLRRR
jgi:hypothetical protein